MSDFLARAALATYRIAGSLGRPLVPPYVVWRASRGKEEGARRRERYGLAGLERREGPLVWVHAASVGESAAVSPMVRAVADLGLPILMTTGTRTSAALVAERLGDCVTHQYVPLDLAPYIRRFLDHWRPDIAITAESEIWPTTMHELARRRVPLILVNARLSDRSFARWSQVPRIAEAVMEKVTHVVAQSELDAERYRALGAPAVSVAGNLKAEMPAPTIAEAEFVRVARAFGDRPVWAAVSTHPGEEAIASAAHRRLKASHPRLITLVVPRHVTRGDEIAASFEAAGLKVARRSRGELPGPDTDVMLGDTMHEMGLYLRLTEIVFVGKSLTGTGGQNPLEAAMLGNAILSGRAVQNFRDIYGKLVETGGARIVSDEADLAEQLDFLLSDSLAQSTMAAAARAAVREMRGGLRRTMAALHPFLHPLELALSLDRRAAPPPPPAAAAVGGRR
ncbi:3-deoxy-D-manno-octulosonic acid transferase [Antarcticirhabdus aurantiaca]|uniref:3-deoxy-D-manno-octulosonic acid transferase n=1 Tax=Antarcticirhabdus aurantiaca TaxID=2606717 RepID=A0ACD4NLJ1_9HYPH|nr:3-deoxy-D-manno-octulosonic acid transferase [Antarcticirhabdus aurantiaca]WAJ27696.1 3-deoxy-D-manno-octulosonic acid transferase [Jeongeuplla avenae]